MNVILASEKSYVPDSVGCVSAAAGIAVDMARHLLGLILLVQVTACARQSERTWVRHLVDSTHSVPFSRESVTRLVDASFATNRSLGSLSGWRVLGMGVSDLNADGSLTLEGAESGLALERLVDLPAAEVDVIEIDIEGVNPASEPTLRWMTSERESCEGCFIRQRMWRDGFGTARSTHRFEVGVHPDWSGEIGRLEIMPTSLRSHRVRLKSVRFLKERLDPDALERVAGSAVLFTAQFESRPALLLNGTNVRTFSLRPRAGDVLLFGFARESSAKRVEELWLSLAAEGRGRVERTKFSIPEGAEGARWHDHVVNLDQFAGDTVRVEFRLNSKDADGEFRGLSFLSAPVQMTKVATPLRPNVVLISIDTLRADRMSLHGYNRRTTPALSAWAEQPGTVTFDRAVAAAASTLPSHASMFTGLDAIHHGAYLGHALAPEHELLAERLSRNGYRTVAVTGGGYVHPRFGLAQGFDRFIFWPRGASDEGDELQEGVRRAQEILGELGGDPFFLFFHTYEVHAPYRARQPFYSDFSSSGAHLLIQPWAREENADEGYFSRNRWPRVWGEGDPRDLRSDEIEVVGALYDSGVARADALVGSLLDALRLSGSDRETIVAVTSDHGEALGEGNLFDHGYLYEHNLHVPLIIRDPRVERRPSRVGAVVRHVDILPTILDLVGHEEFGARDGVSLAGWIRSGRGGAVGLPAWSYAPETNHGISLRKGRWKFILRDGLFGGEVASRNELYDLSVDPLEERNQALRMGSLTAEIRPIVERELTTRAAGTEIVWKNSSMVPAAGVLHWDPARRHNSKWSGPAVGEFRMSQPGHLEFRIPADSTAKTSFLTSGETSDYRIEVDLGGEMLTRAGSLSLAELCAGGHVLVDTREPELGLLSRGLRVSAQELTTCGSTARNDRIEDRGLAADLKALGYLR